MAYNGNYLSCADSALGGLANRKLWFYTTTDASATIVGAGYISDAAAGTAVTDPKGMEVGDIVIATKVTTLPHTTPLGITVYVVSAISGAGAATLIATAIA